MTREDFAEKYGYQQAIGFGSDMVDCKEQLLKDLLEIVPTDTSMIEFLESVKIPHYCNDEDSRYSCPATGQCADESKGTVCNCGASSFNRRIDIKINELQGSIKKKIEIHDCPFVTCELNSGNGTCCSTNTTQCTEIPLQFNPDR